MNFGYFTYEHLPQPPTGPYKMSPFCRPIFYEFLGSSCLLLAEIVKLNWEWFVANGYIFLSNV